MRSRQISCVAVLLASALLLQSALSYGQSGPVGVQITPQNSFVSAGNVLQFTATRPVQHWLTSDGTVVTINSAGMVTGVQPGVVTITAISGIFRNSTTLTVVALPLAGSLTAGVPTIAAGQSTTLTPTFSGGTGVITNNQDSSALLVASGNSVSVSPGITTTYTLTVTNQAGSTAPKTAIINVVAAPGITSFTPGANIVTNGSSTTLTAVFSGGTGSINPGGIGVSVSPASVAVFPNANTTYTLTINGANGSTATANTTVQAVPPPIFTGGSFTGSPSIVTANNNTNVTLNIPTFTVNTTDVVTNKVKGNVINATPAEGSTLTVPSVNTTTTFILTETNQAGTSISAPFTVTAVPTPVAVSLTASASTVTSGSSALLVPNFSNGTGVINNGVGNVGSGSVASTGPLSLNTIFTLTVTNAAGAIATVNSLFVTVVPQPHISSFTVSLNPITSGQSTNLTGNFTGGVGVITDNIGDPPTVVTSGSGVSVSPTQNVIYTLTVTNAAGTTTTANVYVDVD